MDTKMSVSFCQSPGFEMPGIRKNLESEYEEDGMKSENMSVYARIRPLLQREEDAGYIECIAAVNDEVVRAVVPKTSIKFKNGNPNGQEIYEDFTYTSAFGPETGQFVFFEKTIMNTMQSFIDGQNCLIFSYGITNSGKTYTLQGNENNPGIIIMGLRLFFASIEHQLWEDIYAKPDKFGEVVILNEKEKVEEMQLKDYLLQVYNQEVANKSSESSVNLTKSFAMTLCDCFSDKFKPDEVETTLAPEEMEAAQSAQLMKILSKKSADKQSGKCNIWISFIEIYNEYIYDLLQPNVLQRKKLLLAEDQNGDVYVKGAKEVCVSNVDEALKLLHLGRRNLRIACTKLNYQSSRSHCIYMIKVVRLDEDMSFSKVNRLSFCDLAGSERATKSKASGMRLKEASYINTSLLVLGRCLEQLRLNQSIKDKKLIPFRESKLTRLFSGHFLGRGKAVMIANASPCEYTFDETLNVLRFSAVAKELILNDSYIKKASSSIQSMYDQYNKWTQSPSSFALDQSSDFENTFDEDIKAKDEMIEKLLDLADSLRNNLEAEKKEKAQLEITIRRDVCSEYSVYSDQLLERQKELYEEQMEELKKIFNKKFLDMEKFKDDKIKDLKEQLAEYETSFDESFDKSMDTSVPSDCKNIENQSSLTAEYVINSSNVGQKQEEVCIGINSDMNDRIVLSKELDNQIEENRLLKLELCSLENQLEMSSLELSKSSEEINNYKNEIKQYEDQVSSLKTNLDNVAIIKNEQQNEIDKLLPDLISLRDDLNFVTEELNATKEQLEQTSLLLNNSQSSESSVKDKCAGLEMKLQNALQDSEVYEKEILQLKESISTAKSQSIELSEEKQKLQDTIFTLSEELVSASSVIELLKKENSEIVVKLSASTEICEGKISAENKCRNLDKTVQELREVVEVQEKKIAELVSKITISENRNYEILEKNNSLKQEYAIISEKLASANLDNENLKEGLKVSEELHAALEDSKMCAAQEENKAKELNVKLEKAIQDLNDERAKVAVLEVDCAAFKNESIKLFASCKTLGEQIASTTLNLKSMKTEKDGIEETNKELLNLLKSEKISGEEKILEINEKLDKADCKIGEYEAQCIALTEDNMKLQEECKVLENKIAIVSETHEKSVDKVTEVNLKLDEANSVIEQQKEECVTLKSDNAKLLETNKILEDKMDCSAEVQDKSLEKQNAELLLKFNEAMEMLETQRCKITQMEIDCKSHSDSYTTVFKNYQSLETEFNMLTKQIETSNEKISEINLKLNEANSIISQRDAECETMKADKAKLLEINKTFEDKLNCAEEVLDKSLQNNELCIKLDEANQELETQRCNILRMEVECKNHTEENQKVLQNFQNLETEFKTLNKQMESATKEIENLRSEKSSSEETLNKVKTAAIADTEQRNSEILDLQMKCSSLEEQLLKVTEENKDLEEKSSDLSIKLECSKTEFSELECKMLDTTSTLKQLELSLSKMQAECSTHEDNIQKLSNEKKCLEEKYKDLSLNKVEVDLKNQLNNKLEEFRIIAKDLESQKEDNLKLKNDIKTLEIEIVSLSEQLSAAMKNVDQLQGEKQAINENSSKQTELIKLLELNEYKASEKIKLLRSMSNKQLENVSDRERQIREKESCIAELEKALLNIQQQMKEMESEHNKKIFGLKQQHEIEIKECMNLKSVAEKENDVLKTENKKLKKTNKENNNELKKTNKENSYETALKDISQTKDSEGDLKKASSFISEDGDKDSRNKSRRALRSRQPEVPVKCDDSDSESKASKVSRKRKSSDEFVPYKKTTQKKQAKEIKPVMKRTQKSERGLLTKKNAKEDSENMSPVQKFTAFMGSTMRSVAQSVTNMPSPRMTRGRKKLFNVDSASGSTVQNWKY